MVEAANTINIRVLLCTGAGKAQTDVMHWPVIQEESCILSNKLQLLTIFTFDPNPSPPLFTPLFHSKRLRKKFATPKPLHLPYALDPATLPRTG